MRSLGANQANILHNKRNRYLENLHDLMIRSKVYSCVD